MKIALLSLLALVGPSVALDCPAGAAVGCSICPGNQFVDASATANYDAFDEAASCEEWYTYGCVFTSDCAGLQAAVAECCTTQDVGAPAPPESAETCGRDVGCDVCPDGTIVDDSKIVTIEIGTVETETESATCAEWFLFGCTFVESDVCPNFQSAAAECCGGEQPQTEPEAEGAVCISESVAEYTECVIKECPTADKACTGVTGDGDTCADVEEMCKAVTLECCPACEAQMETMLACITGGACDFDCGAADTALPKDSGAHKSVGVAALSVLAGALVL